MSHSPLEICTVLMRWLTAQDEYYVERDPTRPRSAAQTRQVAAPADGLRRLLSWRGRHFGAPLPNNYPVFGRFWLWIGLLRRRQERGLTFQRWEGAACLQSP